MIRMMMRPQMTQIQARYAAIGATVKVDIRKLLYAGFTTWDLLLIGAGGGHGGYSGKNNNNLLYGGGGGGGASLNVRGDLQTLVETLNPTEPLLLVAGVAGAHGVDRMNEWGNRATAGADGQDSSFGLWTAGGGKGGGPGFYDPTTDYGWPSEGGDGGANSLSLGTLGNGSLVAGKYTPAGATPNYTDPTRADAVEDLGGSGIATYMNGGPGGGGGTGKVIYTGTTRFTASGGSWGSYGTGMGAPGGSASSKQGGNGGGADAEPHTGIADNFYGSYASGQISNGFASIIFT